MTFPMNMGINNCYSNINIYNINPTPNIQPANLNSLNYSIQNNPRMNNPYPQFPIYAQNSQIQRILNCQMNMDMYNPNHQNTNLKNKNQLYNKTNNRKNNNNQYLYNKNVRLLNNNIQKNNKSNIRKNNNININNKISNNNMKKENDNDSNDEEDNEEEEFGNNN